MPPEKISSWIRTIVEHLTPNVTFDGPLPSTRISRDLRTELKTISDLYKVAILTNSDQWQIQSNGTTKNQTKIGPFGISGYVILIDKVTDGSVESLAGSCE